MDTQNEFEREILNPDIVVKYSIRSYFSKIIPGFFICAYSLYVLSEVINKNIRIEHLFKLNILTPILVTFLIGLFSLVYKVTFGKLNVLLVLSTLFSVASGFMYFQHRRLIIPHNYVDQFLIGMSIVSALYCLYYIIYANTGTVTLSKRRLVHSYGVFTREKDGTELNDVKDNDLSRGTMDLIFGLAKIKLTVKSTKEVKVIKHITAHDAERINNYLSANTFHSAVEYWTAKDRLNGAGKGSKRQLPQTMDQDFDDSNSDHVDE